MGTRLTPADLTAVLDCVRAVHAVSDAGPLPMSMLQAIGPVVRSSSAAFTQVDPVLGDTSGCMLSPPPPRTVDRVASLFQTHSADHPIVAHAQRTRDGRAMAISDFLTARQFHATGLYRQLFGPMGIEDQLSIGMVGNAGLMIGLSFNRAGRGFSAPDRAVLNLLRPHLLQAYVSCRERQLLRNADGIRRGTVVDRLPVGLMCVNETGTVVWATEPVRQMLRDHYPDAADTIHGLPHAVRLWLRSAPGDGEPLVAGRPGFELRVRRCPLKGIRSCWSRRTRRRRPPTTGRSRTGTGSPPARPR